MSAASYQFGFLYPWVLLLAAGTALAWLELARRVRRYRARPEPMWRESVIEWLETASIFTAILLIAICVLFAFTLD